MLSQTERKALNTDFYTALGLMMQGNYSATGKRIRWTNYKTGIRNVYVRMEVDARKAVFCIDIQHKDEGMRQLFWEQFTELKGLLTEALGDDLVWHEHFYKADGTAISRIEKVLPQGSLYQKETWPELLGFLKKQLLAFDGVWADVYDIFKALDD